MKRRNVSPRRSAERASERRYQELLEQAVDGIFLLDETGRFLVANETICQMLGFTRDEMLRMSILDTYPDEVREAGRARLEAIKSGERLLFERDMKKKDGSLFPVEMSARRLADGTMQGIAHDITQRRRAESELSLERSLLRALLENAPDYIYFKDKQSRFIRTSLAHARAFGVPGADQVVGKTDMDFFSDEHARKAFEDEQSIIRSGLPLLNVEERETWPDRPDTWVSTTKMPLRDQKGNIIGTFGISRDITEHKRAEDRIASLARFPDENPQPVVRVTPDGSVIYANKASESMISSWAGAGERKVPQKYLAMIGLAWDSSERTEIEIHEDARTYTVTVVPLKASGYVNLYGKDVTEEKTLAERLRQAQRMEAIGQLTGGVAHDFNNVLQAILGYCEVLLERLPEENRRYVVEIKKAAGRAAGLTSQLLAFSRKQILRPRVVDTKELIRSIHGMLEQVIGEDVELRTLVDPETGSFLADPGKMEQVLLNLAVNSRDAMPRGGKLTIETSNRTFDEAYVRDHPGAKLGRYVRLAVSDTGEGMDSETLSHIYEPFFTTKEKGKGTGLGLSTVYGVIKQSEGYINCYSEIGQGTVFTIYLPLTAESAAAPAVSPPPAETLRGTETILFVDDDPAVRSVARIALEGAGYHVVEASGAEEALSEVLERKLAVALLITDVVMPRRSGRELAERIKEISGRSRVLYISGYTTNVISHHGILETGVDYLEKPFSSRDLLTRVREILDRPS